MNGALMNGAVLIGALTSGPLMIGAVMNGAVGDYLVDQEGFQSRQLQLQRPQLRLQSSTC